MRLTTPVRHRERALRRPFLRNVVVLAGASALGQLFLLGVAPAVTRLYSPVELGTYGVFASLLGVVLTVGSWRYECSIPLPEQDREAVGLLLVAGALLAITTTGSAACVWIWGRWASSAISTPELAGYLWLLPVSLLCGGAYQALNYWALRTRNFRQIAVTKLAQSVAQGAVQVIAGFFAGPLGLFVGDVAGRGAGTGGLAARAWSDCRAVVGDLRWSEVIGVAKRYWRISSLSSLSTLLDSLGQRVPPLVIASYYGTSVVGKFFLAQQLAIASTVFVGKAVSQAYTVEATTRAGEGLKELRSLFVASCRKLLLVGAVPMGAIVLGGEWAFSWVFGESWSEAGRYAQGLAVVAVVGLSVTPLWYTLHLLDKQGLQLAWVVLQLVMSCGILLAAALFALPAYAAVLAYCVSQTCVYGLYFWITLSAIDRCIGEKATTNG